MMDRDTLLVTTRVEFLDTFLMAVDRVLPHSATALIRAAEASTSQAEQIRLFAAYSLLREYPEKMRLQISQSMNQLLDRSLETTYSTFRPSSVSTYAEHGLTLLETTDHEDQLRIDDVTAHFRFAADAALRDLNMRIAILFGQDSINERENPFRPFLFCRAISSAIASFDAPADVRDTLFDRLAIDMRSEIATVYDAANVHLAWHGIVAQLPLRIQKSGRPPVVQPARPVADAVGTPSPDRDTSGRAIVEQTLPAPPPGATAWQGTQDLRDTLDKLLAATQGITLEGQHAELAPLAMAPRRRIGKPLADRLSILIESGTPPTEAMTDEHGNVRNLIVEQRAVLADSSDNSSDNSSERMTIDVMAMLFEHILRDPQPAGDLLARLGRLQFPILKIALRETALLTHPHHPARLLMNRIASLPVRLHRSDPGSPAVETAVGAEVSNIIDALLADRSDGSDLCTTLLARLDAVVAQALRATGTPLDLAVTAIEQARSRTRRFSLLQDQLADALSGIPVDPFLHHFLTTSWVRVIERAERNRGTASLRFRRLVPDLLWSILPKPAPDDRTRLVGLLPELVGILREGMHQQKLDAARQHDVMNWLVNAHRSALRQQDGTADGSMLVPAEPQHRFRQFIDNVDSTGLPGMTPASDVHFAAFLAEALAESQAQLQMLDARVDSALLNDSASVTTPDSVNAASIDRHLRPGVAVQITLAATVVTGQVEWIDTEGSRLIVQIDHEPVPAMLSMPLFLHLHALGRVRLGDTTALFDRAMQSLTLSTQPAPRPEPA